MDMMMNMEIVPNWHPIFVHFTIGLLSISANRRTLEFMDRGTHYHRHGIGRIMPPNNNAHTESICKIIVTQHKR